MSDYDHIVAQARLNISSARAGARREALESVARLADEWSDARLDEANAPIISGDVFRDDGVMVSSAANAHAGYRLKAFAQAVLAERDRRLAIGEDAAVFWDSARGVLWVGPRAGE